MPYSNEYGEYEEFRGERHDFRPLTMVTVTCVGCMNKNHIKKRINIRTRREGMGVRVMHCTDCHWQFELRVAPNGGTKVWTSDQHGAQRREIAYEKVWQERTSK